MNEIDSVALGSHVRVLVVKTKWAPQTIKEKMKKEGYLALAVQKKNRSKDGPVGLAHYSLFVTYGKCPSHFRALFATCGKNLSFFLLLAVQTSVTKAQVLASVTYGSPN